MEVYIKGIGNISPQDTLDNKQFLDVVKEYTENQLNSIEPIYKDFIPPMQSRRMSRILKMSNVAAQVAIKDADIEKPDAINIATGLGCMADTEKFLTSIINNDEELLTPTAFIQSTHNTIGGQIALSYGVNTQNFTFSHNENSFEHALLDSILLLKEKEASNVLLGGSDEITPKTHIIKEKLGLWKDNPCSNLELLKNPSSGTIEGEGASFFVLSSDKSDNYYAKISDILFVNKPPKFSDIEENIFRLLASNNLILDDIDLVISGINGDQNYDKIYNKLGAGIFKNAPQAWYKHLCGEYITSSAFAIWLASRILKEQRIPEIVLLGKTKRESIDHIIVHNSTLSNTHSFILLSKE